MQPIFRNDKIFVEQMDVLVWSVGAGFVTKWFLYMTLAKYSGAISTPFSIWNARKQEAYLNLVFKFGNEYFLL